MTKNQLIELIEEYAGCRETLGTQYDAEPMENQPIIAQCGYFYDKIVDHLASMGDGWQQEDSWEEPVHDFFCLTYCNYQVVPRVLAQSMPIRWQRRWVRLMKIMFETANRHKLPEVYGYKVLAVDEKGKFCKDPLGNYDRGRRDILREYPISPQPPENS